MYRSRRAILLWLRAWRLRAVSSFVCGRSIHPFLTEPLLHGPRVPVVLVYPRQEVQSTVVLAWAPCTSGVFDSHPRGSVVASRMTSMSLNVNMGKVSYTPQDDTSNYHSGYVLPPCTPF